MFNKDFMKKALEEAHLSGIDIPVGCVIVKDGEILASEHNLREKNNDVTSHAEILALKSASKKLNNWRLLGCDLYVTLEPCPMCAWAILNSRISNVYFGSFDTKYGALGSRINLSNFSDTRVKVLGAIMEDECDEILRKYFLEMRK